MFPSIKGRPRLWSAGNGQREMSHAYESDGLRQRGSNGSRNRSQPTECWVVERLCAQRRLLQWFCLECHSSNCHDHSTWAIRRSLDRCWLVSWPVQQHLGREHPSRLLICWQWAVGVWSHGLLNTGWMQRSHHHGVGRRTVSSYSRVHRPHLSAHVARCTSPRRPRIPEIKPTVQADQTASNHLFELFIFYCIAQRVKPSPMGSVRGSAPHFIFIFLKPLHVKISQLSFDLCLFLARISSPMFSLLNSSALWVTDQP